MGTTLSLFCLVKQDVMEEIFINQSSEQKNSPSKKKKGLFSFLRKKTVEEVGQGNSRNVKYALKLTGYVYKKVAGIEGKVTQLIESNNQLVAAGIFGVASVEGLRSTAITLTPVRSVYMSNSAISGNYLHKVLSDDEIKSFSRKGTTWQQTHLLDTLDDYVSYIFEDKLQNIWLCGRTDAIKVETVDGEITAVEQVPFSNPAIDESVGLAYGSEVCM